MDKLKFVQMSKSLQKLTTEKNVMKLLACTVLSVLEAKVLFRTDYAICTLQED